MSQSQTLPSYKTYWFAWFVLLILTVLMVFVGSKPVLALGMLLKALIIGALFMHLKFERASLILAVVLGIFLTTAIMVVLLVPDGMAM